VDNNKNIITTKIKLSYIRIVSDGETKLQAPNTGGIIHPSFSQPESKVAHNTT